jgi:hypothetical protein
VKVTLDDNVTLLPVKNRKNVSEEKVFLVPPPHKCFHRRYIVDQYAAEVTCGDCGEKLNPYFVLQQLSNKEHHYHELHARYHDELKRINERSRTKCEHCKQMTRISAK